MYLAEIELKGFKSFYKRKRLKFSKGISAIVGPNGCGKTNIIDAIRWGLGEQSPTFLRCDTMTDAIFKGTKDKKPLSMAEVKLLFKETEGLLSDKPNKNSFSIKRRFYKSGKGEYFIDSDKVRLKDIQHIFMDTGIGSRVYSVIRNDMIDPILSGGAEQRRALFEEAAQITTFKENKRTSKRKLSNTRDIIKKVMIELESKEDLVSELKKQVKRAKRFKRNKKRIKNLSLKLLKSKYFKLSEKIGDKQDNRDKLQKELGKLEKSITEKKAQQTELSNKKEEIELQVQKNSQKNNKLRNEYKDLENKSIELKNSIDNKQTQIEDLKRDINENSEFIQQADDKRSELKQDIQELKQKISKKKNNVEGLEDKIYSQEDEVLKLRGEFKEQKEDFINLEKKINSETQKLNNNKSRKQSLEDDLENFASKLQKKKSELQDAQQKIGEIKAKQETLSKEKKKLDQQLASLKKEAEQLEKEYNAKESIFQEKREEYQDTKRTLEFVRDLARNFKGHSEGAKEVLQRKEELGALGSFAEYVQVKEKYIPGLELALQNVTDGVIFKNKEEAHQALDFLKSKDKKSALIILDELDGDGTSDCQEGNDQSRNFIKNLRHDSLIEIINRINFCELDEMKEISPQGDEIYVDKEGTCLATKGLRIVDLEGEDETSPLQIRNRYSRLETQVSELKEKLQKARDKFEVAEGNLQEVKSKIKELESDFSDKKSEIEESSRQISQEEYKIESIQENIEYFSGERSKKKEQIQDIEESVSSLQESLLKHNKRYKKQKKKVEKKEEVLKQKESELKELEKKQSDINLELVDLKNKCSNKENEFKAKKLQIEKSKKKIKKKKEKIDELKDTISGDKKKLKDVKAEREEKRDEIEEIEEILEDKFAKQQEISGKLNELTQELGSLETKQNVKTEKYNNISQKIAVLKSKREGVKEEIDEKYDISPQKEETEAEVLEDKEEYKLEEKIQKLKSRQENLGGYDPKIMERYEEEKENLSGLKEQLDDLRQAEERLKESIKELDRKAKRKFLSVFNEANENFQETFSTLFSGGTAYLELEDEDNPLESDILIKAKPRGKRFLKISQLSAGEKALTATALLFGLYMIQPTPFCFLDEVDGPLDDSNVERYIRMLESFSDQSQFILVTHNPRTMEAADYIYGVTMEEEGISKVLSLSMEDIDAEALQTK